MKRNRAWARPIAAALAVLMSLTMTVPSTLADPVGSQQTALSGGKSLSAAVSAKVASMDAIPRTALAQTTAAPEGGGKSFFKSPRGAAVLALMAVGVGYGIYSASHDRKPVKSPIR